LLFHPSLCANSSPPAIQHGAWHTGGPQQIAIEKMAMVISLKGKWNRCFCCYDKYLRETVERREDLFGLVVSEVWSMIGWLHCFGPQVRESIMTESLWWSKAAHLRQTGHRGREVPGQDDPSKPQPQWSTIPNQAPAPLSSLKKLTVSWSNHDPHQLEPKPSTQPFLGTLRIQTTTVIVWATLSFITILFLINSH
jgi:hypothetical protein